MQYGSVGLPFRHDKSFRHTFLLHAAACFSIAAARARLSLLWSFSFCSALPARSTACSSCVLCTYDLRSLRFDREHKTRVVNHLCPSIKLSLTAVYMQWVTPAPSFPCHLSTAGSAGRQHSEHSQSCRLALSMWPPPDVADAAHHPSLAAPYAPEQAARHSDQRRRLSRAPWPQKTVE